MVAANAEPDFSQGVGVREDAARLGCRSKRGMSTFLLGNGT